MKFEPLTDDLVSSALRLSRQAGWNQTEEDWKRLCRLTKDGVGVWVDNGEVRASYSVISYAPGVAWIGMILVDETYRGGGLGKKTFETALEHCRRLKIRKLGLDATHLGEPIYRKYGFETVCGISRWKGEFRRLDETAPLPSGKEFSKPSLILDALATGVDRRTLLEDLLASPGSRLIAAPEGYALIRKGDQATHLGPVVARNRKTVEALFASAARLLEGETVICDVLDDAGADEILERHGLTRFRELKRMTAPARFHQLTHRQVVAGAGFELG